MKKIHIFMLSIFLFVLGLSCTIFGAPKQVNLNFEPYPNDSQAQRPLLQRDVQEQRRTRTAPDTDDNFNRTRHINHDENHRNHTMKNINENQSVETKNKDNHYSTQTTSNTRDTNGVKTKPLTATNPVDTNTSSTITTDTNSTSTTTTNNNSDTQNNTTTPNTSTTDTTNQNTTSNTTTDTTTNSGTTNNNSQNNTTTTDTNVDKESGKTTTETESVTPKIYVRYFEFTNCKDCFDNDGVEAQTNINMPLFSPFDDVNNLFRDITLRFDKINNYLDKNIEPNYSTNSNDKIEVINFNFDQNA